MSGIINKVKDALHHDKDHSATGTTHSTTGTTTTGTHTGAGTTGLHGTSGSTNAGPHSSNVANKADPRVDSDLDGRGTHGTTGHSTTGHSTTGHSTTGAYGTSGSTNAGPHDSNLANKADPRVDSDLDRSTHGTHGSSGLTGTHGTTGTHGSSGLTGTHGTTGTHGSSGLTGTHGTTGTHNTTGAYGSNTTAGPHSSNLANKADPRVDSDLDGSRHVGGSNTGAYSGTHAGNTTGTHTGTHGGISHSTNAGPHDSNLANKADPRVDSDLDGKGNRHGAQTGGVFGASGSHATAGSGTAQNTAGPHNSDLLNKIDPRVDSDRDGSKTYGGNATHQ